MKMIQISDSKVDMMSENVEKILRYGGKLMSCIEELSHGEYGERNYEPYDDSDDYMERNRMGMRSHRRMRY